MEKTNFRIWSDNPVPGIKPHDYIAQILNQRVDAVSHYLKSSTELSFKDDKQVHQLRKWSRRSIATLQLYREVLPQKQTNKLVKYLSKIRKTAGEVRNYDVLIQKYKTYENNADQKLFLKFLNKKRRLAQLPIEKTHNKYRKGKKLANQLECIQDHIHLISQDSIYKDWNRFEFYTKSRIQSQVADFLNSWPINAYDICNLHKFRIKGKALRYAMEITAFIFTSEFKNILYPEIKKIQSQLGNINDLVMLTGYLQNWIKFTNEKELIPVFRRLYEKEDLQLINRLDELQLDYHQKHIQPLKMKFDDLFQETYHQVVA